MSFTKEKLESYPLCPKDHHTIITALRDLFVINIT